MDSKIPNKTRKVLASALPVRDRSAISLAGKCLVAVPGIGSSRFNRAVILLCANAKEGSMGIIINKPLAPVNFDDFLSHLNIKADNNLLSYRPDVVFGGPVESSRGFVVHTADYALSSTFTVGGGVSITSTIDMLNALAIGKGPAASMIALGYAGWDAGQLEDEIKGNSWLIFDPDPDFIFKIPFADRWEVAMKRIGATPGCFSLVQGNA